MPWGMNTRRIARRLGLALPASVICWLLLAGTAQASASATAPDNTSPPSISGTSTTPQQGQTLTLTQGMWDNSPTLITDAWEDCDTTGASCTPVASGAIGPTYNLTAADVGHTIEVLESENNTTETANSAATATVTALAPTNAGGADLPAITGTAQQGQTLTASTGTWSNTPTSYAYQWESCTAASSCSPVGTNASTYLVAATDVGHTIEVQVTATNSGGSSAEATSAATAAVVPPAPTSNNPPTISGTAQQGQTLTENHGQWTNGPTSYAYQWWRCDSNGLNCALITGATLQTYTSTAADVGATLYVTETATNSGGSGSANSGFTSVVTNLQAIVPAPVDASPPALFGIAQQGEPLSVLPGTWSNNPNSYSHQWERCYGPSCSAIPGATSQTYTPTAYDVGARIAVEETGVNTGGAGNPAMSAQTAVVTATSATSLSAPLDPVTNQTVTLVATITSSSGNGSPSGSITFKAGNGAIGGCANQPVASSSQSATVTCQTTFAAGRATLSAIYAPGTGSIVTGSTSSNATVTVGRAPTATSLNASAQVNLGSFTTYRATVDQPEGSGPIEPSGTIEFLDHNKPISACRSRSLVSGKATCRLKYKSTGKHSITATYGGDSNFSGSRSSAQRVKAVVKVLGYITSNIAWSVTASSTHTWFAQFLAYAVSPGTSLFLTCHGHECPFVTHTTAIGKGPRCVSKGKRRCPTSRTINLLAVFHGAHVGVGSKITLSILRCGWYGRYYTLVIRPLRQPSQVIVTLGNVGVTRRGLRC